VHSSSSVRRHGATFGSACRSIRDKSQWLWLVACAILELSEWEPYWPFCYCCRRSDRPNLLLHYWFVCWTSRHIEPEHVPAYCMYCNPIVNVLLKLSNGLHFKQIGASFICDIKEVFRYFYTTYLLVTCMIDNWVIYVFCQECQEDWILDSPSLVASNWNPNKSSC